MKALPVFQLIANLNQTAGRYAQLQSVFEEFCAKSASLASKDAITQGIRHSPDRTNNRLEVAYCGKVYRFAFAMDRDTKKGVVTCTLPNGASQKDAVVVGSFTFDGNGDTDVQNTQGHPLRIDTLADAAHLVLHMIYQDINKSAE